MGRLRSLRKVPVVEVVAAFKGRQDWLKAVAVAVAAAVEEEEEEEEEEEVGQRQSLTVEQAA